MNLKNSLFAKVSAFCLLIVGILGGILTFALTYEFYVVQGAYEQVFADTSRYYGFLYGDASNILDYGELLEKSESEGLTAEEQEEADYLLSSLFPPAGSNIAWALLDADGACLLTNMDGAADPVKEIRSLTGGRFEQLQRNGQYLLIGPRQTVTVNDWYSAELASFETAQKWGPVALFGTGACLLLSIALFAYLVAAAGHKAGVEGIALNPLDRIWTEVILGGIVLLVAAGISLFESYMSYFEIAALLLLFFIGLLILFFSLIRRAKAKMLFKTSFICLLARLFGIIFRHLRITARILGFLIAYALLQFLLVLGMTSGIAIAVFFFITTNVALFIVVCLGFIQYHQICKATERMAAGELGTLIDENTVPFFHHIAHNLNRTGEAMHLAVQKATQSERMKTELITNVSHDIKTPPTPISSYVGLLHTTDIRDPKALEYIDVLDRKSRRLGQLMADLVDASKVTSGNIAVNMEVINLGELVKQAGGEFESRLEERGIQLISKLPETPVFIYADGRHMWRVLDNLFGNAAKYALDGTRVYVDLAVIGRDVILSVKNISRDPLNIHPEELMERFVRGDESRNTEGSGLGLSIARSLMELQGGTMNIQIDGDLFKVILGLHLVDPPAPPQAEEAPAPEDPGAASQDAPPPKGKGRKAPPTPQAPAS